ncbi:predicted protein [Arabidopsis lyrata subsp. lyrata]|uniref:Predicted protein n=1 Tax=Arabidopsis lyrata subsp. lyrata TaxID=81972 RepID=D7MPC6_ARALL|nr:predicted protein [Arabidopsis lyrata subsp. lyrata]
MDSGIKNYSETSIPLSRRTFTGNKPEIPTTNAGNKPAIRKDDIMILSNQHQIDATLRSKTITIEANRCNACQTRIQKSQ